MCNFIIRLEMSTFLCVIIVLLGAISMKVDENVDTRKEIVIVGLIPTTHEIPAGSIGRGIRPAVQLALDLVNNHTGILKNYLLKITLNDTECDMAKATKFFFDMMDENTTKIMLFGDACSNVTGPMAQIAKWWNMWQLSYADTDPKLSDRSTYTNFFRTVPSDSDFNPARISLLRFFNWTRVGTIFQDASTGSDRYGVAHHRLIELLDDAGIDVVKVESFLGEPDTAILHHKNEDVRIILGFFDHIMARKVFCSAYKRSVYGPKYQWIILGDYPANWWLSNNTEECTNTEIETAIQGYFSCEALPLSSGEELTESGLTPTEYLQMYNASRGLEYSKYHGYAFDGVWVIAKAIDHILRHTPPSSLKEEMFRGSTVASALNETNFLGVTGKVQFDGADRIGHVLLQQYQDGAMVKIGEYKRSSDELHLLDNIQWRGNGPPRDRNLRRWDMQRVSVEAYNVICFMAGLGIVMATVFLMFNIVFRNHRYIKMSSPNMNNVIIVGCILSYLSVFLLGTDSGVIPTANIEHVCTAQSWVLSVGFSLSFGAMFSKTWRVHAIFTNIKLNKKIIKDYKLFSMVCVLVLIDGGILTTWQVMDHLYRATKDLPPQIVDEYEVVPVIEYCTSHSIKIWLGILYAYKGLLLVFGSFLAWETKNVNISALNDSKYIGMSVYNVVIMCVCGAAISFIIKDQPTPAFVIISLFIIFSTTITLCLVFVPKLIELKRDPTGEERSIRATLQKKKQRKEENGAAYQKRIRDVVEENKRYKEIIKEKSEEIRILLEQLGEDSSAYNIDLRPHMHKKVMELRIADMSPGKISRGSSASDADNVSTLSDTSAFTNTYTWGPDSPTVRQRFIFRSIRSTASTDTSLTESVEMVDYKKPPAAQTVPVNSSLNVSDEGDCLFGGVYCGHSETQNINRSVKENYGMVGTTDKMIQAGPGALGPRPYNYRRQPSGQQGVKDNKGEKFDTVASVTDGLILKVSPQPKRIRMTTCSPVVVNATIHKQQEDPPAVAWKTDVISTENIISANETLSRDHKDMLKSSCPNKKFGAQKPLDDITE